MLICILNFNCPSDIIWAIYFNCQSVMSAGHTASHDADLQTTVSSKAGWYKMSTISASISPQDFPVKL